MHVKPALQIVECSNVKEGDTLWNDTLHTIRELPIFLKGSILYKLPKHAIKKGITFTMKCPKNSDIYIAYKTGWRNEDSLLRNKSTQLELFNLENHQQWTTKAGEISYDLIKKSPFSLRNVKHSCLSNILHYNTCQDTTITLPKPGKKGSVAIFLQEGK